MLLINVGRTGFRYAQMQGVYQKTILKEEIVKLIDDLSEVSEKSYVATEKIAETIRTQSTSLQNANSIVEDLLKLANQLK